VAVLDAVRPALSSAWPSALDAASIAVAEGGPAEAGSREAAEARERHALLLDACSMAVGQAAEAALRGASGEGGADEEQRQAAAAAGAPVLATVLGALRRLTAERFAADGWLSAEATAELAALLRQLLQQVLLPLASAGWLDAPGQAASLAEAAAAVLRQLPAEHSAQAEIVTAAQACLQLASHGDGSSRSAVAAAAFAAVGQQLRAADASEAFVSSLQQALALGVEAACTSLQPDELAVAAAFLSDCAAAAAGWVGRQAGDSYGGVAAVEGVLAAAVQALAQHAQRASALSNGSAAARGQQLEAVLVGLLSLGGAMGPVSLGASSSQAAAPAAAAAQTAAPKAAALPAASLPAGAAEGFGDDDWEDDPFADAQQPAEEAAPEPAPRAISPPPATDVAAGHAAHAGETGAVGAPAAAASLAAAADAAREGDTAGGQAPGDASPAAGADVDGEWGPATGADVDGEWGDDPFGEDSAASPAQATQEDDDAAGQAAVLAEEETRRAGAEPSTPDEPALQGTAAEEAAPDAETQAASSVAEAPGSSEVDAADGAAASEASVNTADPSETAEAAASPSGDAVAAAAEEEEEEDEWGDDAFVGSSAPQPQDPAAAPAAADPAGWPEAPPAVGSGQVATATSSSELRSPPAASPLVAAARQLVLGLLQELAASPSTALQRHCLAATRAFLQKQQQQQQQAATAVGAGPAWAVQCCAAALPAALARVHSLMARGGSQLGEEDVQVGRGWVAGCGA
jgi:hypothetical protein